MQAQQKSVAKKPEQNVLAVKAKKSTKGHKKLLGPDIAAGSERTALKKATQAKPAPADDIRRKESPQRRISGSGNK